MMALGNDLIGPCPEALRRVLFIYLLLMSFRPVLRADILTLSGYPASCNISTCLSGVSNRADFINSSTCFPCRLPLCFLVFPAIRAAAIVSKTFRFPAGRSNKKDNTAYLNLTQLGIFRAAAAVRAAASPAALQPPARRAPRPIPSIAECVCAAREYRATQRICLIGRPWSNLEVMYQPLYQAVPAFPHCTHHCAMPAAPACGPPAT